MLYKDVRVVCCFSGSLMDDSVEETSSTLIIPEVKTKEDEKLPVEEEDDGFMAPQVMLNEDGEIIINEQRYVYLAIMKGILSNHGIELGMMT